MHAPRQSPAMTPEKILNRLIGILKTDLCCHGNENLGFLTQSHPYFDLHETYGQNLAPNRGFSGSCYLTFSMEF